MGGRNGKENEYTQATLAGLEAPVVEETELANCLVLLRPEYTDIGNKQAWTCAVHAQPSEERARLLPHWRAGSLRQTNFGDNRPLPGFDGGTSLLSPAIGSHPQLKQPVLGHCVPSQMPSPKHLHNCFLPSPFLPSRFSLSGIEPERSFRLSTRSSSETDTRLGLDWCRWESIEGAASSVSAGCPRWFLSQKARLVFGAGTSPCVPSVFCSVTHSAFLRYIQQSRKKCRYVLCSARL